MQKISWFKRLFMSWEKLESYFGKSENNQDADLSIWQKHMSLQDERVKEKDERINELKIQVQKLNDELIRFKVDSENKDKQLQDDRSFISQHRDKITELQTIINEKQKQNDILKTEINEKLSTIGKIEKTFFASSGNKGKGELGELQVKAILEKSGLTHDFWTENLLVNSKTVEFAIKSGMEDKWIPVDSKVLEHDIDEENNIIIDDSYSRRVKVQAKSVAEYLGKKNTADYGILVLQSDEIYMKLYDQNPQFFQEVIKELKIYIASPSSFVQFAWSISNILDVYEKVHNDEKIYEDMIWTLESVRKFADKLQNVHKDFNIAMGHHHTIVKKHNDLAKRLMKNEKITEAKMIELKNTSDEE